LHNIESLREGQEKFELAGMVHMILRAC